jgi:metal-responsive CopG/Arc/MetJ family transcriptional regulator
MATVKTGISIERALFDQVSDLAEALHMPRSQVFAVAVEEFIQRHQNREMLATLNEVYGDGHDRDEEALLQTMRRHQRQLLENEW